MGRKVLLAVSDAFQITVEAQKNRRQKCQIQDILDRHFIEDFHFH